MRAYREFVHFALTSQDINNTAQPLAAKDALQKVWPNIGIFPHFTYKGVHASAAGDN